jgi:transposase-like protein
MEAAHLPHLSTICDASNWEEHPTFNEGLNHFYCRSCHHNTTAPFPFHIPR